MSSLAAARADGYYFPREWRPEFGSLNRFRQSHARANGRRTAPARVEGDDRTARRVVRFEMPFDVWCSHCDAHIGRGVRFNARKKSVGRYLSSVVYEFAMRCARCGGDVVLRTDPKARGYELVRGVQPKADAEDAQERQTERLNDAQVAEKLQRDPFYRLEHENEDKRVAKKRSRGLEALVQLQDAAFRDDYASNSALRAQLRSDKKQRKRRQEEATRLGIGGIPLLDVHPDDVVASRAVVFTGIPQQRSAARAAKRGGRVRSSGARSSAVAGEKADPFECFGDPVGSKLRCMKMARRAAEKKRAATMSET
ncbi:unnamed protein product [Hyaloperonospora brassicae]|uniref:Uncharacterized protein n=1 Tax=Hyaloperonospora brassicae TaxID=162125 RepID=A0AAV0T9X4_HYABA|nr:unnamed protein product [Hyaloperonospora brassicae]